MNRSEKSIKISGLILIILVFLIAFKIYNDKKSAQWSLQVSNEMFSGPTVKRVPVKNASLAAPVDPKASRGAANILKYFYALSGNERENFILSGQNIGSASEPLEPVSAGYEKYFKALEDQTGKLPAIMGIDYGWEQLPDNYTEANKILIDYWKKGGLITISVSPSNPFTGGGLRDFGTGGHKYNDLFTPGTEAYKRWIADLDRIATGLKALQDAGVVVLWRPLHEMNGDWFWWSYGENGRVSKEEYAKLWKYMFDYFTKDRGLHNLLWIYSPSATMGNSKIKPVAYYYPGGEYIDIVGMDYYWNDMTKVNEDGSYDALVSLNKPVGFAEIGAQSRSGFDNLIIIKAIDKKLPQMVFAVHWQGWTSWGLFRTQRAIVENPNAKEFMNDPLIVTLGSAKH